MRFSSQASILVLIVLSSLHNLYALSEASGITWNHVTGSYFLVGDEGAVCEMDQDLNILRTLIIGSFDLEAIAFNEDRNSLYCLDEKNLSLIELDPQSLIILNFYPLRLEKEKKREYSQFESLVYRDGTFYLSASTTRKNKEFGTLFSVTLENNTMNPIADIPLWDISGMSLSENFFYFISDEEDLVARYSLSDDLFDTIDLPGNHQEGVVLTDNSQLLVIDEDGSTRLIPLSVFSETN